ncbi:MAG: acyltransferase [Duncaniella sp.]|nr:acyltransferase [Duncaniella sp.]
MMAERDTYIDFLRAIGLILLIGVHVNAPDWYVPMRSFDVPLMVFVSCLCYKPLRGGYLAYGWKRFKRIYYPVATFLVIFFVMSWLYCHLLGKPQLKLTKVAGSFLLLNWPSIGYVWIMRVFLMMALIVPLLYSCVKKAGVVMTGIAVLGIILVQHFLVEAVAGIDNKIVRYAVDETVLYAFGYSSVAVFGLKIRNFSSRGLYAFLAITGCLILVFISRQGWTFDPQEYKYPPQSLYLLYGVFGSGLMWSLRPLLARYTKGKVFTYLSEQSMWLYLWHIIPVFALAPIMNKPDMWAGRYVIVLVSAVMLNIAYQSAKGACQRAFAGKRN